MKVHITIHQPEFKLDETITGATADEIVGKIKAELAGNLPFAMRLFVNAMSNLAFAQEIVKRYNQREKKALASPATCEQFLLAAEAEGFATIDSA